MTMSELTPDEIRNYGSRALRGITSEPEISALVRMALRTHDAEQRAERAEADARYEKAWKREFKVKLQQAEAENARLRVALRDVRPEIDSLIAGLYRSHVNPFDGIVHDENVAHELSQLTELHERIIRLIAPSGPENDKALATPPEGDGWYCAECQMEVDPINVTYDERHEQCGRVITDDVAPPQPEDALAALDALKSWADSHAEQSGDPALAYSNIGMWVRCVRRHLTAIAVPYVPEQIRRLPDAFREDGGEAIAFYGAGPSDVAEACADELERAIASAPAVPDSKYRPYLEPFVRLMDAELHANAGKGDRPGWLSMSSDELMLEVYYHAAKLQKAVRDGDSSLIKEHSADVANMSMMLLDLCVGLEAAAAPTKGGANHE